MSALVLRIQDTTVIISAPMGTAAHTDYGRPQSTREQQLLCHLPANMHWAITCHLQGLLFKYGHKSTHVAFMSNPQHKQHIVLVGGLTDGLLPTPYCAALTSAAKQLGWSVVQAQLSSSYQVTPPAIEHHLLVWRQFLTEVPHIEWQLSTISNLCRIQGVAGVPAAQLIGMQRASALVCWHLHQFVTSSAKPSNACTIKKTVICSLHALQHRAMV